MADVSPAAVVTAFERALQDILARVPAFCWPVLDQAERPAIAVAYSGGLDSSVLLHLARQHALQHGRKLFAFHVHHGVSSNADHWLAHCRHEAQRLGVSFDAKQVHLASRGQHGLEEAARRERYAALGALCRTHDVPLVLTAHHQDDQAETVMLQLLRGCGIPGLAAMAPLQEAPELFGDASPLLGRPLLGLSRAQLENFARAQQVIHIEDESNRDASYSRNALRLHVKPTLAQFFPGFASRLARTAQHAQAAQRLLDQLAAQDLQTCSRGEALDIAALRCLDDDRTDNLLRFWLSLHGMRLPSTAWLAELKAQVIHARDDAQVSVAHSELNVGRYRNRIYLIPKQNAPSAGPRSFFWRGEAYLHFPEFGGTLYFDRDGEGVPAEWLAQQELCIHYREGGERLKLAPNRPTRSLKQHYQAAGMPLWRRRALPLVSGGKQLLFAAGIGTAWLPDMDPSGSRVKMRWEDGPPAAAADRDRTPGA